MGLTRRTVANHRTILTTIVGVLACLLGTPASSGEVPFDLWIGDDGLVARFELVVDGSKVVAGALDGVTFGELGLSYELFDLGATVDLAAPPADQVTDLADARSGVEDLLGSLEGLELDGFDLEDLFGD